ncbi:50S ribosomal protein L33 [Mycoplasma bradburyae]|uniref:Large ribosomal subunit protein bL33 n=1 Tax=Mycoplasma bradburyae TaxID=2963128 RepID=A0AAW6HRH6_9MOLU|nr:50S ribosomal protein L33 [Mycoplasma bradburyae]MDC4163414.1 50S ribosomal protein L33 [Mycoplasma bradburyae]MDC4182030.1 50S ribosomal protein L33 [Mycoplasma bradburyae]MDC4182728.1 50S ribosomal protein L33 [Mycoplasma bradburyae]MDC4183401.1 50S ribosomal protein L33 [Mycoplasma bradburyae]MDC4184212.1 50S ribosomal protein L33 [Mycoplasma bradburyae]
MAQKRGTRLGCDTCNEINYITRKNAKKNPEKLNLHKYCSRCRQATMHKEVKRK